MRLQLKMTSSALKSRVGLKLALLWNLTPLRSLKVYVLPSADTVHDSARPGTMLVVPISNSTNRLNIGTDTASNVVPVVKNWGWNPSGLPSEQYTSVPLASADSGAAASANATISAARTKRWWDWVDAIFMESSISRREIRLG